MNDEQLKIFLTVAESGSFSKAGETGYLSKQAMLKQINLLEEEIGFSLFVRRRSGTALTPSGEEFYKGIRRLLRERDRLVSACLKSAGAEQVLRVGNVEHQALLTPVTQAFAAQYPRIRIQQIVHPNHSGEWRVGHGIQDVAETFYNEMIRDAPYSYTPLTTVPYVAAMRKGHPLAGEKTAALSQLCIHPVIIFPMMIGHEHTKQIRAAFSDAPRLLFERSDVDNQVQVAYSCLDSDQILITANPFIESIEDLVKVPLGTGWTREYGVIYQEPMTPQVRLYVELAKKIYQER